MKLLSVFLLVAFAATAQHVEIEFDQSTDFSKFKTFTVRDGQINSKAPALNNDIVRRNIEAEIRKRLSARGLLEVPERPDLNVRYTLGSARKNEVETYPAGWRGLATRRVRVQYTEGTLVIDLRDTSRRELVWRAIATEEKGSPAKIEDRLDEMVKKAIDKYPPKK